MATMLAPQTRDAYALLEAFDQALMADSELKAWAEASRDARDDAAQALRSCGDRDSFLSLRFKESVLFHLIGLDEQAFSYVHDVWRQIEGTGQQPVQALVLTQLAACSRRRGDLRGAVRAARRAEAIMAAFSGDATPQILAIRVQLTHLLDQSGIDSSAVEVRKLRTVRALETKITGPDGPERFGRLRSFFVDQEDPAHWALSYHRRWTDVHPPR